MTFFFNKHTEHERHLKAFIQAYGGSISVQEPDADVQFFKPRTDFKMKLKVVPPAYIYTSKFNYDSLLRVRDLIAVLHNDSIDSITRRTTELELTTRLDRYTQSIRDEKPMMYHVYSKFRFFKTFYFHSGTRNLFYRGSSELNKIELLAKVFYSMLYMITIIGGFIGSFILFFRGLKNINYLLISTMGLYFALITPFVLKMDQDRYFVPGYPLFLMALVYLIVIITDRFSRRSA
jgi:hypothetical protein